MEGTGRSGREEVGREEGLEGAGTDKWERGSRERRESKGEQKQKGEAGREERVRRLRTFKMCMIYSKTQVCVPTHVL